MKRVLALVAFLLVSFCAVRAQDPAAPGASPGGVLVTVTLDHPDWRYTPGETPKFSIVVTQNGQPVPSAKISYQIGPEMMPAEKKTAELSRDGAPLIVEGGTMHVPGFLRCIASVERDGGGRPIRGMATAGFSPEKIQPTQIEPADFDEFWAKTKAELAALPIDPWLTPLPEESNEKVEVFQVALQNISTPPSRQSRFYGILCVPRGDGPFPAMMIPPGAGIRKLHGQKQWAERGFITLEVGVHGIPVTLPQELYSALAGAIGGYPTINLDDRNKYYFRRIYMGCVRANDYLVSLPKWDHKNLIAFGGSQGGMLSIVTTALDPRVTACVVAFPAYCDVTGYVHGRAGGWPGLRELADEKLPGRDAKIATTGYFDSVNFAKRIKVPGHYGWGFNDETCPPTSTFSAYNQITAPKTLSIFKEMGHPRVPGLTEAERTWLMNEGLKK